MQSSGSQISPHMLQLSYDVLQKRMIDLIGVNFIEIYNKFAAKRNLEMAEKKDPTYQEYNNMMLLLASYIYFKDDISTLDVLNYKCAFIMMFPEYIRKNKHRIVQSMVEAINMIQKPEYKPYIRESLIVSYSEFLHKLFQECK